MKTFIEIENLDRVKDKILQDRFGVSWTLDKVTNGKKVYSFHFSNITKGKRIIELKRDMHDAGCWKISSYSEFDLVSIKILKDPALLIAYFSNILS